MLQAASRDIAPGEEEAVARDLAHVRAQSANRVPERLRLSEEAETGGEESIAANVLGIDRYGESTGETIDGRDEGRIAERLGERLEKKRREMASFVLRVEQAGKDVKHHAYRRYRQAKRVIRIIRLATVVGVSLGDIFFSLNIMALMIIIEWAYSKFNPNYLMFDPRDPLVIVDKTLFYFALAEIAIVAILIVVFIAMVMALYDSTGPFASLLLN